MVASCPPPVRILLVGDRSHEVAAHERIGPTLRGLASATTEPVQSYWLSTDAVLAHGGLEAFDGIWLVPGSPYRSLDGALAAVRAAREGAIPFLGTCGGFQHALIELGRDRCGVERADHAESSPDGDQLVIVALRCSLIGGEGRVTIEPGTRTARTIGGSTTLERYHCAYGLDPAYLPALESAGVRVSGRDDDGEVRIIELDDHPFFVATLFQPELSSTERWAHPLIGAFVDAARERHGCRWVTSGRAG